MRARVHAIIKLPKEHACACVHVYVRYVCVYMQVRLCVGVKCVCLVCGVRCVCAHVCARSEYECA